MQGIAAFLFFIGFTGFIVGAALLLGRRQARRTSENLAELARALGLRCAERPPLLGVFPLPPTVEGERGGRGDKPRSAWMCSQAALISRARSSARRLSSSGTSPSLSGWCWLMRRR